MPELEGTYMELARPAYVSQLWQWCLYEKPAWFLYKCKINIAVKLVSLDLGKASLTLPQSQLLRLW